MEANRLLHDRETFGRGRHLPNVFGVVIRLVTSKGETDPAVIDAHLVPHFAAEKLVDGKARGLAGYVPERDLDDADGGAPRLEAASLPDFQHHPLYVGGIFAQKRIAEREDVRLQKRLPRLHLRITVDACVRDDPHDGTLAQDRAFEVDDLHLWLGSTAALGILRTAWRAKSRIRPELPARGDSTF
jgi:hypothetical protein